MLSYHRDTHAAHLWDAAQTFAPQTFAATFTTASAAIWTTGGRKKPAGSHTPDDP